MASPTKLETIETAITNKMEERKVKRGDMYIGNTLTPGMEEKDDFLRGVIDKLNDLSQKCSSAVTELKSVFEKLKDVSKGLTEPKSLHKDNRKKRHKKRKSKSRKEKRLKKPNDIDN